MPELSNFEQLQQLKSIIEQSIAMRSKHSAIWGDDYKNQNHQATPSSQSKKANGFAYTPVNAGEGYQKPQTTYDFYQQVTDNIKNTKSCSYTCGSKPTGNIQERLGQLDHSLNQLAQKASNDYRNVDTSLMKAILIKLQEGIDYSRELDAHLLGVKPVAWARGCDSIFYGVGQDNFVSTLQNTMREYIEEVTHGKHHQAIVKSSAQIAQLSNRSASIQQFFQTLSGYLGNQPINREGELANRLRALSYFFSNNNQRQQDPGKPILDTFLNYHAPDNTPDMPHGASEYANKPRELQKLTNSPLPNISKRSFFSTGEGEAREALPDLYAGEKGDYDDFPSLPNPNFY